MKSFKFLVFVFLHLSLRGTDAAPTTTPAPNDQYSWEWNEMEDYYKGDELEVEYEQPTQPPYRPTTTRPAYRPTPPPTRPAYRPTAPPPTRPAYVPTRPPPYGAVPNPTVEFEYEEVGSDYPAYQEATYGPQKHCHEEDRVTYEDRCESYVEQTCRTHYVEECRDVEHNTCTGNIVSKFDQVCEDVEELLCDLEEKINYDPVKEDYNVQKCWVEKEVVCDTVVEMELQTKYDYQCCDVPMLRCDFQEHVVDDHTCTHTLEFDCKKEKRTLPGEYGMHMMCRKVPKNSCYKTPRTVQKEVCHEETERYCQKFTSPFPQLVEKQHCHLEPKKTCQLVGRTRTKKAKRYSYTPNCRSVPRQVCDHLERKVVEPVCKKESRPSCEYVAKKGCIDEPKQYCWKVEKIVKEEVCDDKYQWSSLY